MILPTIANSVARALGPGWRWLFAIGIGVPSLLGVALVVGAAISWLTGGYERPATLEAGLVDEFAIRMPKLFEEDDVWLVRLTDGEFVALYDRGLESGCPLQWRREFEFMERRGWFVDACSGAAYDLLGRCFSDDCRGALLDRFAVNVERGNVIVDLRELVPGPALDPNAEPVSRPNE